MDRAKFLFMDGISMGVDFTAAIAYVFWAIASLQWWLLIVAALWVMLGLLQVRTAKKNFAAVQTTIDLARVDGMIAAYDVVYGTDVQAKRDAEAEKQ